MKTYLYAIYVSIFLTISCSEEKEKHEVDIKDINGYWEIVQAQNPYGKNVIYTVNTQIDYFEVKDSLGFRKKLKPDLNGNYTTSRAVEKFSWAIENDTLRLNYKTPLDQWQVDVLRLNDSLMLLKNKKNFLYTYKKFEPINVQP